MAFLTTLLGAYGGYGKGRESRDKENDTRTQLAQSKTYQDAQIQQQQDELARQKASDAVTKQTANSNLTLGGIDPVTGKIVPPLPIPANLQPGAVDPTTKKPYDEGTRLSLVSQFYQQNGQPWNADWYTKSATAAGANFAKYGAGAASYAKADEAPSVIALNKSKAQQATAQAGYLKQRYGIDMARINSQVAIARQRDATQTAIAATNAQQRASTALQTEQGRIYAVQLAQVYAAQYHSAQMGVQLAIAQASDAERSAAATESATKAPDPNYNPQAPIQPVTVNLPPMPQTQPLIMQRNPQTGAIEYVQPGVSQQPVNPNVQHNTQQPLTDAAFAPKLSDAVAHVKANPHDAQAQIDAFTAGAASGAITTAQRDRGIAAIKSVAHGAPKIEAPTRPIVPLPVKKSAGGVDIATPFANAAHWFATQPKSPRYQPQP